MRGNLLAALTHNDEYIRWAAAEALGYMADRGSTMSLLRRLDEETWPPIVASIIRALGKIGDQSAIAPLLKLIDKASPSASAFFGAIGEALGRMSAVSVLQSILDNPDTIQSDAWVDVIFGALPYLSKEVGELFMDQSAKYGVTFRFTLADPYAEPEPDIDALQAELLSEDPVTRRKAIVGLGRLGTEESLTAVLNCVLDENSQVSEAAGDTLCDMAEDGEALQSGVDLLVQILTQDEDFPIRLTAAKILVRLWILPRTKAEIISGRRSFLSQIHEPSAAEKIAVLLDEEDPQIQAAGALLLGLAETGDQCTAKLIRLLNSPVTSIQPLVIWALGRVDTSRQCLSQLLAKLDHEDLEVRVAAMEALGGFGRTEAVPPLIVQLRDAEAQIRTAAVSALIGIRDTEAVPALIQCLDDIDPSVRLEALRALGEIGDASVGPRLMERLSNPDATIRKVAAAGLGNLGNPTSSGLLLRMLEDDADEDVRSAAAESFSKVTDRTGILELLGRFGDDHDNDRASVLASVLLKCGPGKMRSEIVDGLSQNGYEVRIARRGRLVSLKRPGYQHWRANGSEPVGDLDPLEYYLALLKDPDPIARWEAAYSLEDLKDVRAVVPLILCLLDPDAWVRCEAGDALESMRNDDQLADLVEGERRNGVSVLQENGLLPTLVQSLVTCESEDYPEWCSALAWVLNDIRALCDLLIGNRTSSATVRSVLWMLCERYNLRLMPNGEVILATGERLECHNAALRLR